MRKSYITVLLMLFALVANAQIVNIPDANFKAKLLANTSSPVAYNAANAPIDVDANNDDEIQLSEAALVYKLVINSTGIVSLEGINSFVNLRELYALQNEITAADLNLPLLEVLFLNTNNLSALDLSNCPALEFLEVGGNPSMTSLNVSQCLNLDKLIAYYTGITGDFDFSQMTLSELDFEMTNVSSVTMGGVVENGSYRFTSPQMTSLDFVSPDTKVQIFRVSAPLTSLNIALAGVSIFDVSHTDLSSVDFSNVTFGNTTDNDLEDSASLHYNSNLTYLNVKNGSVDGINLSQGNPNLTYICADDLIAFGTTTEAEMYAGSGDWTVSSYCSFQPGGDFNTIAGAVTLDTDGSGCESSNPVVPSVKMVLSDQSGVLGQTYTNANGQYVSYIPTGNQTVSPEFNHAYYTVTPELFTSAFTAGSGQTATADFCVTPNGDHPDLTVTVIPIGPARPGFDAHYRVIYANQGTEVQSVTVTLAFDDDHTDFVSANPTASAATGQLSWTFANLAPFEQGEIELTVNVNSPIEAFAVNIGDLLHFTANVTAGDDETPADNTFDYDQVVVGSFDPNDKSVSRESIGIAQLGDYLYYTIRFQNTGTFYAENVVVKDLLSSNLDLHTLQMVSASHPYRATLTNGNKLEFFFEGINLPAVVDDEPGSHGYVTFKIKPKNTLIVGNTIVNEANIYFDFNSAIVTNTVNTVVTSLGVGEIDAHNFALYPNPVENNVTIALHANMAVKRISVFNILGQLVKSIIPAFENGVMTVNLDALNSGTYFIQIATADGTSSKKLIKL